MSEKRSASGLTFKNLDTFLEKYLGTGWPGLPWHSRKLTVAIMEEMQSREKGKGVVMWLRIGYSLLINAYTWL